MPQTSRRARIRACARSLAGSSSVDDARAFFRTSLPPSDRCMERTVSKQIPIAAFIPIGSRSDGGSVYAGLGTGNRGPFVALEGGRLPLGSSTVRKGPYLKTGGQPRTQSDRVTHNGTSLLCSHEQRTEQTVLLCIHSFLLFYHQHCIGTFTATRYSVYEQNYFAMDLTTKHKS